MAMPYNSISFLTCLKVVQVSVDSVFVERVVVEITIVRVHLTAMYAHTQRQLWVLKTVAHNWHQIACSRTVGYTMFESSAESGRHGYGWVRLLAHPSLHFLVHVSLQLQALCIVGDQVKNAQETHRTSRHCTLLPSLIPSMHQGAGGASRPTNCHGLGHL